MAADPLAAALGQALTGEQLELSSVATLPDDLAAQGFDAAHLTGLREQRKADGAPWPFPVPLERRRELGFARFDAALAEARNRLGLTGLVASRSARRALDADERRLAADRPPHWG